MTDTTPQNVRDYLSRLDTALADLPREVSADIVAGIREELDGLDAADSAARIQDLGDPAFIAAEARAATPAPEDAPATPAPGRVFSITAIVVLIAGSFLVPVVGALVGLVWVSLAKAWSRREKLILWLAPIVASAIGVGIAALLIPPAPVPGNINAWHLVILLAYLIVPIEGIVLLVRAHGRGWRPRR